MRHRIQSVCVPLALALAACSCAGERIDIGDDKRGIVAQGGGPDAGGFLGNGGKIGSGTGGFYGNGGSYYCFFCEDSGSGGATQGSGDSGSFAEYAGHWDGYVEAYQFASGTDHVHVTLDAQGQGTFEVGEAPAIPPPSDPTVGYPDPNAPFGDQNYYPSFSLPFPGFGYPVHGAVIESGRIRFTLWGTDLVAPWCEMQQSYLNVGAFPESYGCSVAGGGYSQSSGGCFTGNPNMNPQLQLDCGQVKTCYGGCECTATECHGRRIQGSEIRLDGALAGSGDELVGTLVLPDDNHSRVMIRMTRN